MFRKKINKNRFKATTIGLMGLVLLIPGCQRDDICPETTPTTPQLLISFFDIEDPDIPKTPRNLTVKASDLDTILLNQTNLSEIRIPLRTGADLTEYDFILNAPANIGEDPDEDQGNRDQISFTYAREEEYINRACSYRVIFLNFQARQQPGSQDPDRWIKNLIVEEENIEDETNTHISIYH